LIAAAYVGHAVSVGVSLILVAGAFLLSIVSFRLIENPIRSAPLRRPITTSGVLWGTSMGLVMLVALFNLQSIAKVTAQEEAAVPTGPLPVLSPYAGTPHPKGPGGAGPTPGSVDPTAHAIPAVVAAVRAAQNGSPIPSPIIPPLGRLLDDLYPEIPSCWELRNDPQGLQNCSLFPGGARGTIVLIGDSHARQWLPDIAWMAKRDGWTLVPLWHTGCWPASYDAGGECQTFVGWAARQVRTLRPDVVLIGGEQRLVSQKSMRLSAAGIGDLAAAVRPSAQHVVVIGDPPAREVQPVDCLLAQGATLGTCNWTLTHDQVSVYRDVERAAVGAGASFLDTIGWFCYQKQCPAVVGHTVAFREFGHITATYATELRALFRDAFTRAVSG
jgi:hypothetical protein